MSFVIQHPVESFSLFTIAVMLLFAVNNHLWATRTVLKAQEKSLEKLKNIPNPVLAMPWSDSEPRTEIERTIDRILYQGEAPQLGSIIFGFEGANASARYLAGIFVFVGLLGTVAGIAFSVNQLAQVVSGSNTAASEQLSQVTESVRRLLGSMGAAFFCTLAGIAATIGMSLLNTLYQRREILIIDKAEKWIYDTLLPKLWEHQSSQNLLGGITENTENASEAELIGLLKKSVETLGRNNSDLKDAIHSLSSSAGTLAASVPQATQSLQSTLARSETLRDGMVQAASQLSSQTSAASQMVQKTAEIATLTSTVTGEVLTRLEQAESLLTKNGAAFGEISQGLQKAAENLSKQQTGLRDDIGQAVTDMSKAVRSLREDLAEDRVHHASLFTTNADRLAKSDLRLSALLGQFQLTLTEMTAVAGSADLAREMNGLVAHVHAFTQEAQQARTEVQHLQTAIAAETVRRERSEKSLQRAERGLEELTQSLQAMNTHLHNVEVQSAAAQQAAETLYDQSLEQRLARGLDRLLNRK